MDDRRQYPRVNAPVRCRPVGRSDTRDAIDVSLGGMRIYLDDPVEESDRLELDVLLPEGPPILCTVEVVWVEILGPGASALLDVGVKFVMIREADRARLAALLERSA